MGTAPFNFSHIFGLIFPCFLLTGIWVRVQDSGTLTFSYTRVLFQSRDSTVWVRNAYQSQRQSTSVHIHIWKVISSVKLNVTDYIWA